jgi:hypothetical protein
MIVFPTLHGQVHVEPGRAGSPEVLVRHPPDTHVPGVQHPAPAQAGNTQQHGVPAAREPLPAAGSRMPGRQQPRLATGAAGGAHGTLPDAYIGTPQGDLQSDLHRDGVLIDASGQSYVPVGNHYYAVRNDSANGTWRVVQLQDPVKPGIPVRRDAAGTWRVHSDAGMPGGRPVPTHAQIDNDLRATQATLNQLTGRRTLFKQDLRALHQLLHEYETFQQETRADLQVASDRLQFSEGMAAYFTRQVERGNPEPSFRTTRDEARRDAERARTAVRGLRQLIAHGDTRIGALWSHIVATRADLHQTVAPILHATERVAELHRLLNDSE